MGKDRLKDLSELLSAYLDGELEESVRAEVVAYLDRDAGAVQILNELRETRSMLQDLPHQSAPSGFSESVVSAVERQALLGEEPETAVQMSMRRRWGPIRAAASIALLVGAAGSWIYWQSERREFTDLALRSADTADTTAGRAFESSIEPIVNSLAMVDDDAVESSRSDQPRNRIEKSTRGKAVSPAGRPADVRSMTLNTEMKVEEQQQSIADGNLTTLAGVDEDEEVVAIATELDAATAYLPASGAERVDFGLAGQLRGSRRGGADRADFMRRLQANEPAVSLASYDFSNESNMLTLSFANDAQRAEFTHKFEVYLKDNSFLSAADPLERTQVVAPLTQNVVLRGRQGLNYVEPRSEQILLTAAPEMLEGLIDRYAETTDSHEDTTRIELKVGEMKVQGLESTRRIVRAMAVPEVQRRILGEAVRTADIVDHAAADPDERLTATQWREHYARLRSTARAKEGQTAFAQQSGTDKDDGLALSEYESGEGAAGEKNQGEVRSKKKQRRARPARVTRPEEIELFGGLNKSPPASESDDRHSQSRRGGVFERPKGSARSRPIGRAANLTFVLKLQTLPPTELEPIRAMGPPAPSSESDESEE